MLQNNLQNYIEPAQTLSSGLQHRKRNRLQFLASYPFWKRVIDVAISLIVLLILVMPLLLLGVLIKLDSQGSILFRQKRVGKDGKLFTCLKLRTMHTNADPEVHRRYMQAFMQQSLANQVCPDTTASTMPVFKLINDPRVTKIGAVLRRLSLDELPQFWNVLVGEMSLVGPRPALPYEVEAYDLVQRQRLMVPQGITGWWQVFGRSRVSFAQSIEMDLHYIAERSFTLDLYLLIKTIPAMLSSKGAH